MIIPIKAVIVEEMRSAFASEETLVNPTTEGLDILSPSPVDDANNVPVTVPSLSASLFPPLAC
ncbi:hypothetical protein QCA50_018324 [Cerrena zonata]|uniref:Uncharacterized protein n=1 Tax=Cerrena zonata TaxID=2478898 RepID=A0AAW0FN33_9APHY